MSNTQKNYYQDRKNASSISYVDLSKKFGGVLHLPEFVLVIETERGSELLWHTEKHLAASERIDCIQHNVVLLHTVCCFCWNEWLRGFFNERTSSNIAIETLLLLHA